MLTPKTLTPKSQSHKTRPNIMPRLPKIESTESMVDISMLDVMAVEDFLSLLKNKTENNTKELWKETCGIAWQLKAARELLSIGSNLISNRSSKKILDRLIDVTSILLSAERVYILEVDSSGKDLVVTHAKDEAAIGIRIPVTAGIEGDVYMKRACANVSDANQDPRYIPALDTKLGQKARSVICAPIIADGACLGVVQATNKLMRGKSPRDLSSLLSFSSNEGMLLGFIATNMALCLKQASLSASMSSQVLSGVYENQRDADFNNISKKMMGLEGDHSLQKLVEFAYKTLDAERVSIFTYSASSKSLVCTVSQDIKGVAFPSRTR